MIYYGLGFSPELVRNFAVPSTLTAVDQGTGMIFKYPYDNSVAEVTVGSTAGADKFAGWAFSPYRITAGSLPNFETGTVPSTSPFQASITSTPLNPTTAMRVAVIDPVSGVKTPLTVATSGAADATTVVVNGLILTFDSSFASFNYEVSYTYTPSVLQMRSIFGDVAPGLNNTGILGNIPVIVKGTVVLSNYDTAVDWSTNVTIKLDATGKVTTSGTGLTISNWYVSSAPNAANPFLILTSM